MSKIEEKIITTNTIHFDYLESKNIIIPELILFNSYDELKEGRNERLKIFDKYIGKGGHQRFIEDQIRGMVKTNCPETIIYEFIMRQINEHRPDLFYDDLRDLKELNNEKWNLFELKYDYNRPKNFGANFGLSFSGVYAIYQKEFKNLIIYIGTAINLRQRFIQHIFPLTEKLKTPLNKYLNGNFEGIKIKVKRSDKKFERLTLEARLIHKIKPFVNTHYKIRES